MESVGIGDFPERVDVRVNTHPLNVLLSVLQNIWAGLHMKRPTAEFHLLSGNPNT